MEQKDETLLHRLEQWNEEGDYRSIISAIEAIPPAERDYFLTCQLARAYNNLVVLTGADRQYLEKAAALLGSVREEGRADPLWHYRLGYSLLHLHRYPEALACYRTSLELDPEDTDTQYHIRILNKLMAKEKDTTKSKEKVNFTASFETKGAAYGQTEVDGYPDPQGLGGRKECLCPLFALPGGGRAAHQGREGLSRLQH